MIIYSTFYKKKMETNEFMNKIINDHKDKDISQEIDEDLFNIVEFGSKNESAKAQKIVDGVYVMNKELTLERFLEYFEKEEISERTELKTELGQNVTMIELDKIHELDINNIHIYNVKYFLYYEDDYFVFMTEDDNKIVDIGITGFINID
jgi:hypothetical protein